MMIAELPLNPLPLPALVAVLIVGAAVVVVGIETLGCGNPGVSGLLPWPPSEGTTLVAGAVDDAAPAAGGSTSVAPRSAIRTARSLLNTA